MLPMSSGSVPVPPLHTPPLLIAPKCILRTSCFAAFKSSQENFSTPLYLSPLASVLLHKFNLAPHTLPSLIVYEQHPHTPEEAAPQFECSIFGTLSVESPGHAWFMDACVHPAMTRDDGDDDENAVITWYFLRNVSDLHILYLREGTTREDQSDKDDLLSDDIMEPLDRLSESNDLSPTEDPLVPPITRPITTTTSHYDPSRTEESHQSLLPPPLNDPPVSPDSPATTPDSHHLCTALLSISPYGIIDHIHPLIPQPHPIPQHPSTLISNSLMRFVHPDDVHRLVSALSDLRKSAQWSRESVVWIEEMRWMTNNEQEWSCVDVSAMVCRGGVVCVLEKVDKESESDDGRGAEEGGDRYFTLSRWIRSKARHVSLYTHVRKASKPFPFLTMTVGVQQYASMVHAALQSTLAQLYVLGHEQHVYRITDIVKPTTLPCEDEVSGDPVVQNLAGDASVVEMDRSGVIAMIPRPLLRIILGPTLRLWWIAAEWVGLRAGRAV
ncbi:hypothetical protein BJ742DRAFT_811807 [Cladochytrium replicatum]|nr:hypothetical protein BJ742DRAFT_811807 [Cladochytrium replicatum]